MALSEAKLQGLAKRLAAAMGEDKATRAAQHRPHLRLIDAAARRGMDDLTRESHCRMIRHLRRRWGSAMQLLIDQATFGLAGIEQLDDDALIALHQDLERAQDCLMDGVSFEDAGLIRRRYA